MRLPNVRGMAAVDSVSKLLRGFLPLFRRHAYVLQDIPFFCLPKILGSVKDSFHNSPFLLFDYTLFIIEQMKKVFCELLEISGLSV